MMKRKQPVNRIHNQLEMIMYLCDINKKSKESLEDALILAEQVAKKESEEDIKSDAPDKEEILEQIVKAKKRIPKLQKLLRNERYVQYLGNYINFNKIDQKPFINIYHNDQKELCALVVHKNKVVEELNLTKLLAASKENNQDLNTILSTLPWQDRWQQDGTATAFTPAQELHEYILKNCKEIPIEPISPELKKHYEESIEFLERAECEKYRNKNERGKYLQKEKYLYQDETIRKIKEYIALELNIPLSCVRFGKEWFDGGICHGVSVCHSAMAKAGKLEWWKAAINELLEWDGHEHSLSDRVVLPQSDLNVRWYSIKIRTEKPVEKRRYSYLKEDKSKEINIWKERGIWHIQSDHESGAQQIKDPQAIKELDNTVRNKCRWGGYNLSVKESDELHLALSKDPEYKRQSTISKGILFRRITDYLLLHQAAFSYNDPFKQNNSRTTQKEIIHEHFVLNDKMVKGYASMQGKSTIYEMGKTLQALFLLDVFANICIVHGNRHASALRYENNKFYFKDPNYLYGEKEFSNLFELAAEIIKIHGEDSELEFLSTEDSNILGNLEITPEKAHIIIKRKNIFTMMAKHISKQFLDIFRIAKNNPELKKTLIEQTERLLLNRSLSVSNLTGLWSICKDDSELKDLFKKTLSNKLNLRNQEMLNLLDIAKNDEVLAKVIVNSITKADLCLFRHDELSKLRKLFEMSEPDNCVSEKIKDILINDGRKSLLKNILKCHFDISFDRKPEFGNNMRLYQLLVFKKNDEWHVSNNTSLTESIKITDQKIIEELSSYPHNKPTSEQKNQLRKKILASDKYNQLVDQSPQKELRQILKDLVEASSENINLYITLVVAGFDDSLLTEKKTDEFWQGFPKIDEADMRNFLLEMTNDKYDENLLGLLGAANNNPDLLTILAKMITTTNSSRFYSYDDKPILKFKQKHWRKLCELANSNINLKNAVRETLEKELTKKFDSIKRELFGNHYHLKSDISKFKHLIVCCNSFCKITNTDLSYLIGKLNTNYNNLDPDNNMNNVKLFEEYLCFMNHCLRPQQNEFSDNFLKQWSKLDSREKELRRIEMSEAKFENISQLCRNYKTHLPTGIQSAPNKHRFVDPLLQIIGNNNIPNIVKISKIKDNLKQIDQGQMDRIKTYRNSTVSRVGANIFKNCFGFCYGYHSMFKFRPTHGKKLFDDVSSLCVEPENNLSATI